MTVSTLYQLKPNLTFSQCREYGQDWRTGKLQQQHEQENSGHVEGNFTAFEEVNSTLLFAKTKIKRAPIFWEGRQGQRQKSEFGKILRFSCPTGMHDKHRVDTTNGVKSQKSFEKAVCPNVIDALGI